MAALPPRTAGFGGGGRVAEWPWGAILFGVALFAALSVMSEYIVRLHTARERAAVQNRVIAEAAAVRAGLEAELNSTIYVAVGLAGYIAVNPDLDPAAVALLLPSVYRHGRHLRNIGLAPDNVIRYVYPVEGNEAALGLRYEDRPDQWPAVSKAMETRETVLSGPVDLIQGGRALINRTPIFQADGRYWGILSLVIDLDSVLDHVQRFSNPAGVRWGLRDPDAPEAVIAGDGAVFTEEAVRQTVTVPGNAWEFAAAPRSGSAAIDWRYAIGLRAAGYAIAAIISLLASLVLADRSAIRRIAAHDPLTGLPNRRRLHERLTQTIALAHRHSEPFALLFVDLDGFKPANDRYGHRAGDHVLREIAARMQRNVRTSDMVARVGGDEFVIVLPDAHAPERAAQVARHIESVVAEPIPYAGNLIRLGASVGVAMYPYDGLTPDELMRQADEAMYREKAARKANAVP